MTEPKHPETKPATRDSGKDVPSPGQTPPGPAGEKPVPDGEAIAELGDEVGGPA